MNKIHITNVLSKQRDTTRSTINKKNKYLGKVLPKSRGRSSEVLRDGSSPIPWILEALVSDGEEIDEQSSIK
jgi:hypothetical protein